MSKHSSHQSKKEEIYFIWDGFDLVLHKINDEYHLPKADDIIKNNIWETRIQVGKYLEHPCILLISRANEKPFSSNLYHNYFSFYQTLARELLVIVGRSMQIDQWIRRNRFCGTCRCELLLNSQPIHLQCVKCGANVFPASYPSIIVGIYQDDKILLVKTVGGWPGHSLVAGFLEPGETLEDGVRREIHEEVGLKIKNIRYEFSQPFPPSNSIMIGYTAEYDSGKIQIQEEELSFGGWFKINMLPGDIPPNNLIGGKIITLLKERIRSKHHE